MTMDSLAATYPSVREFEAEVVGLDGSRVVLERTYFYAESGGQPADRGTIEGERVVDVQTDGGTVVHELVDDPPFDEGDEVTGVVDDDLRTYCMRAHTASHALYGAGRTLLDDLGYGGFDIGTEKVRVDFSTTTEIDDGVLVELERLVNRAVWESRAVSWEEIPVEEARERDAVAFNTKTEEGVMADADAVRVVTIEGWDWAACGGTHVSNTAEIGPVEVLGRSNPGEGLTRVEFAVGPSGIDRRATLHAEGLRAARELGVAIDDLSDAVASISAERERLRGKVDSLTESVLTTRVNALPSYERGGRTWRVGTVAGFDPNRVGEAAKAAVGDGVDVVAVVGGENPFVVVASAGEVNAGEVIDAVTAEFGGGGGGGPTFAQGGGLDATPESVVEHLRTD